MLKEIMIERVDKYNFSMLVELIKELARYEKLPTPTESALKRLKIDCLFDKPKFEAYIGLFNGNPIGYTMLIMTYSSFLALPTLFIEDLFILQGNRGMGYGQIFFDYIKKLAKQKGCGRIDWNVLDWNASAIKFYKKNGGKYMKEWLLYRIDLT